MPGNIKIGILGGDMRQVYLASRLSGSGECAVWGLDKAYAEHRERLSGCVRVSDWQSAIRGSSAVVLPLPASTSDGRVSAPLCMGEVPTVSEIIRKMEAGQRLFGGMLPEFARILAAEQGVRVCDYYDSEALQIKNSVPTAEGAIAAAIDKLDCTLFGMKATVVGYGRCGRVLSQKLISLGARVTVAARSTRDLSNASIDGATPMSLDRYRTSPAESDCIFNTVPHLIFERDVLSKLKSGTVIFELASASAGVDLKSAGELGVCVYPLPSLPGRCAPRTAGEIIAEVIEAELGGGGNG